MNSILVLLNGQIRDPKEIRRVASNAAMVLCTDGGARHAAMLGLEPRLVIGDMDSLPKKLPRWKTATFLCDFDENVSDFEKTLRFIARQGFRRLKTGGVDAVYVAGATGGRLDHTLDNLALIEKYSKALPLIIAGENARVLSKGTHTLKCRKGDTVTLLPVDAEARVTAKGLKFALKNSALERSSRGLSNRATSGEVRIAVHSGRVWAVAGNPGL